MVDEARKQGLILVGHVPDTVRASEASDAGQKSIEHLTGVFEGCSTAEDDFLNGNKGPKRFLETYNELSARALIARSLRSRCRRSMRTFEPRGPESRVAVTRVPRSRPIAGIFLGLIGRSC